MTGTESTGDSASGFALIEMAFSFGVVLAIAIWQWWQVRDAKPGVRPSEDPAVSSPDDQEKPES